MMFFGPISSLFDFATFAVLLWGFDAGAPEFRTGWFVESLATQTLVIFAIRTRQVPFFRSHPSFPLTVAAVGVVTVGAVLPLTPLAGTLGFIRLPPGFFAALAAMVVAYLALIEVGKRAFYRAGFPTPARAAETHGRQQRRRIATFAGPGDGPSDRRSAASRGGRQPTPGTSSLADPGPSNLSGSPAVRLPRRAGPADG
jgi:Mg2+-importing ATPase